MNGKEKDKDKPVRPNLVMAPIENEELVGMAQAAREAEERVEKIELERLTNIYHQILINLNDATKR